PSNAIQWRKNSRTLEAVVEVLKERAESAQAGRTSVASPKSCYIRPALHPGARRCSSVAYSRYAPSSRLARRAHRRPRGEQDFGDATLDEKARESPRSQGLAGSRCDRLGGARAHPAPLSDLPQYHRQRPAADAAVAGRRDRPPDGGSADRNGGVRLDGPEGVEHP